MTGGPNVWDLFVFEPSLCRLLWSIFSPNLKADSEVQLLMVEEHENERFRGILHRVALGA